MTRPPDDDIPDGATPYQPPPKAPRKKDKPWANAVAERILAENQLLTDGTDTVFRYEGGCWRELSPAALNQLAWQHSGKAESSRAESRAEAIKAVKAITFRPDHKWSLLAPHDVGCKNGVLNLLTWRMRAGEPEDYLERVVPWEFDPAADCPIWQASLIEWFGDGEAGGEAIACLQEFFGYVLLDHCRFKKALMLYGESNTGKSRVLAALAILVGSDGICHLGVDDMGDPTRRAAIVGKRVNLLTELPEDAALRDGFREIVVGETVMIDDKYKRVYPYAPIAKHIIATNRLPSISDRSAATYNRLIVLGMDRVFAEAEQDTGLDDKHRAEAQGLLRWSAEGAARLVKRGGKFVVPVASLKLLAEYKRDQNPAARFLEECCKADQSEDGQPLRHLSAEPTAALLREFNKYQGGARISTKGFTALLRRAAGPDAVKKVRIPKKRAGVEVGGSWAGQVTLCLVGWRFVGQVKSRTMKVDAAQAASPADEIESQVEETSNVGDEH